MWKIRGICSLFIPSKNRSGVPERIRAGQSLAFLGKFVPAVREIVQPFNEADQGWNEGPKEYRI